MSKLSSSLTFSFLLAFAIILCVSAKSTNNKHNVKPLLESRISGGQLASKVQFPSFVSIRHTRTLNTHFCSGSILNHRWILTAAICNTVISQGPIQDLRDIELVAGTNQIDTSGYRYFVQEVVQHPNWTGNHKDYLAHNIALIKTTKRIRFNLHVRPIQLLSGVIGDEYPAVVAGWRVVLFTILLLFKALVLFYS